VGGGSAPFAEWKDSGSGRALHAHRGRGVRHSSCRDGRRALQEDYAGGQRRAPGIRLRAVRRAFAFLHLMQGVTTVLNWFTSRHSRKATGLYALVRIRDSYDRNITRRGYEQIWLDIAVFPILADPDKNNLQPAQLL